MLFNYILKGEPPQSGAALPTPIIPSNAEGSRRTAAKRQSNNECAANAWISPLRSLTLTSVEMMGEI